MAYSDTARDQRRCKATRKDGKPCRAYAIWGGERCAAHTYATRRTEPHPDRYTGMRSRAPACTCGAYAWPHRPGGGLCRWPHEPLHKSMIPAGRHSYLRSYKRRARRLTRTLHDSLHVRGTP